MLAGDSRDRHPQSASNPVDRGRPRTALFALDIRERGLAHTDFPGELGLVPAVLLAQAANGCAVLAESSWNSAYRD
jgi:hypothetical protein